jgi:hypothetical protein
MEFQRWDSAAPVFPCQDESHYLAVFCHLTHYIL